MIETATRENRVAAAVFGGMWLLFLAFPVTAVVSSDAPSPWRLLAAASIALFAIGYVVSYLHPTPGPLTGFAGAGFWTVFLSVLGIATVPAIGADALSFLPFLVAISVFRLPTPWDAIGALGPIAVAITLLVVVGRPEHLGWQVPIAVAPLVLMLPIRRVIDSLKLRAVVEHELALSRQRERVGRDVHDILGHSLTVIAVKTDLASRLLEVDPERARSELADVRSLARSSLSEVRATVGQLQAPVLTSQIAAGRTALAAAGIGVSLTTPIPDLARPQDQLFAWCLREAVTNVVRHSGATHCVIVVSDRELTVTDDGRGREDGPEGNGLRGMRDRVVEAGGSFVITEAHPGSPRPGTRVEVAL